MGALDGKVALITGAARGQGRQHAITLAEQGADIIAVDLCETPAHIAIPGSTKADFDETVRLVEALDRRIVTAIGDVRDQAFLTAAVDAGVAELGRLDIVCANAGVWAVDATDGPATPEERRALWDATMSINVDGVYTTLEAAVPHILAGERGGSIVITSSTAAMRGQGSIERFGSRLQAAQVAYNASKHAVVGIMRNYALELAPFSIRVNCVAPTGVNTPMTQNDVVGAIAERHLDLFALMANPMPVGVVEPEDISNAVLYLVTDAGRYVTGTTIPVDGGYLIK